MRVNGDHKDKYGSGWSYEALAVLAFGVPRESCGGREGLRAELAREALAVHGFLVLLEGGLVWEV